LAKWITGFLRDSRANAEAFCWKNFLAFNRRHVDKRPMLLISTECFSKTHRLKSTSQSGNSSLELKTQGFSCLFFIKCNDKTCKYNKNNYCIPPKNNDGWEILKIDVNRKCSTYKSKNSDKRAK